MVVGGNGILRWTGARFLLNASKEWSGKIADLVRKKEKMEERVTELLERQVEADKKDDKEEGDPDIFKGVNRAKQVEWLKEESGEDSEFLAEE